jgi:ABC-type nitrate/sulfonate/bicarbonate transport system substrate-binding protein
MGLIDMKAKKPFNAVGAIAPHGSVEVNTRSIGTKRNVGELKGLRLGLPHPSKTHHRLVKAMIASRLPPGIENELHEFEVSNPF